MRAVKFKLQNFRGKHQKMTGKNLAKKIETKTQMAWGRESDSHSFSDKSYNKSTPFQSSTKVFFLGI